MYIIRSPVSKFPLLFKTKVNIIFVFPHRKQGEKKRNEIRKQAFLPGNILIIQMSISAAWKVIKTTKRKKKV